MQYNIPEPIERIDTRGERGCSESNKPPKSRRTVREISSPLTSIVHGREAAAFSRSAALDDQPGQGRNRLDPAEELVEVRKFDLHALGLRRGRALQRRRLLKDGTRERRHGRSMPTNRGNQEQA